MRTLEIAIGAGERIPLNLVGDFFHLLETTNPINIEFLKLGAAQYTAKDMEFGFHVRPTGGFTGLVFTSAAAQTIKIAFGIGDGGYDRITGTVQIIGNQGAFAQGRISLTNVNQVLAAADANRKYTLLQNNDAAAVMRVNLAGVAATAGQGFRVPAGGTLELNGYQSTAAINVIMETATAAADNVEFVTG